MENIYKHIVEKIRDVGKILIISHRKPDADTLGSAISLKFWLIKMEKEADLACIDKPSSAFDFLPLIKQFNTEFDLFSYDLLIFVDVGASYMTNFHLVYPELFNNRDKIINIDHHASNDRFGFINLIDPAAASTTLMLYRFFKYLDFEISGDIATCLLAGLYGDTGSFKHGNTSAEVLSAASDLINHGAQIGLITSSMFKSTKISTLRLWGKVFENIRLTDDKVVIGVVKEQDFKRTNTSADQLSGVIDYLNMVPGSRFAILLSEDNRGNVKGSLRTRSESLDLSRIAATFGGGGHARASGFTLPGKLIEEINCKIVSSDLSKKTLDF